MHGPTNIKLEFGIIHTAHCAYNHIRQRKYITALKVIHKSVPSKMFRR